MKYFVILVFTLIFSVLYVILRDTATSEYTAPVLEFSDEGISSEKSTDIKILKKNRILICDIYDLNVIGISDSTGTPFLSRMLSNSQNYTSTYNLSPDRNATLKSFFECLPPYKLYTDSEPYKDLKSLISKDMRNSSMPGQFRDAGYITRAFFKDSLYQKIFGKYFMTSEVLTSVEKRIEAIYKSIAADTGNDILYYADMTDKIAVRHYLRRINDLLERLSFRLYERSGMKLRTVLLSTSQSVPLSKTLTVFSGFSTEPYTDCLNVAVTDMSRTLLNLCRIKPRNYFAGFDFSDGVQERDYFAGSTGDTLILFNDSIIYKKLMHSPLYSVIDKITGEDVTSDNIGINEKLEELIPRYFGGDYVKYIILNNTSGEKRTFKIEIRSKRRFEEYVSLENYYSLKSRNYRYTKVITREVEPGMKDTLRIYYAGLYQDFQYTFNISYKLSYGALGTNAGEVKKFSENSYYGMVAEREDPEPVRDHDVLIFNRRINY